MPDAIQVAVEAERVLWMLDHAAVDFANRLHAACLETAQAVADEARRRIARSAGPWNKYDVPTWTKIHWERSRDRKGYVVMAYDTGGHGKGGRTTQHHVDLYLERGTMLMHAQPFLEPSVRVEMGPHYRRLEESLQRVIDEVNR